MSRRREEAELKAALQLSTQQAAQLALLPSALSSSLSASKSTQDSRDMELHPALPPLPSIHWSSSEGAGTGSGSGSGPGSSFTNPLPPTAGDIGSRSDLPPSTFLSPTQQTRPPSIQNSAQPSNLPSNIHTPVRAPPNGGARLSVLLSPDSPDASALPRSVPVHNEPRVSSSRVQVVIPPRSTTPMEGVNSSGTGTDPNKTDSSDVFVAKNSSTDSRRERDHSADPIDELSSFSNSNSSNTHLPTAEPHVNSSLLSTKSFDALHSTPASTSTADVDAPRRVSSRVADKMAKEAAEKEERRRLRKERKEREAREAEAKGLAEAAAIEKAQLKSRASEKGPVLKAKTQRDDRVDKEARRNQRGEEGGREADSERRKPRKSGEMRVSFADENEGGGDQADDNDEGMLEEEAEMVETVEMVEAVEVVEEVQDEVPEETAAEISRPSKRKTPPKKDSRKLTGRKGAAAKRARVDSPEAEPEVEEVAQATEDAGDVREEAVEEEEEEVVEDANTEEQGAVASVPTRNAVSTPISKNVAAPSSRSSALTESVTRTNAEGFSHRPSPGPNAAGIKWKAPRNDLASVLNKFPSARPMGMSRNHRIVSLHAKIGPPVKALPPPPPKGKKKPDFDDGQGEGDEEGDEDEEEYDEKGNLRKKKKRTMKEWLMMEDD